jgi:hypothetical protein
MKILINKGFLPLTKKVHLSIYLFCIVTIQNFVEIVKSIFYKSSLHIAPGCLYFSG